MNPEKRFSQIEEVLSEILIKQDEHTAQIRQLAKSVGQVLEVALDAKDIASEAKGIAIESRGIVIEGRDIAIESRDIAIESRDIAIEGRDIALRVEKKADLTANALAKLTVDVQKGFAQVNGRLDHVDDRFDQLMTFLKEKLG